jgi:hypothetical protein
VLNKLAGINPKALAVEYVGEVLGSRSPHSTYKNIKEARASRRRGAKAQTQEEAIVRRAVDKGVKKMYQ